MDSMDPLLSPLPEKLLAFVEDQLSNNEASSDDNLRVAFLSHGLTNLQATQALRYRSLYQQNLFLRGHTPIRRNKHAIRFDATRRRFERIAAD